MQQRRLLETFLINPEANIPNMRHGSWALGISELALTTKEMNDAISHLERSLPRQPTPVPATTIAARLPCFSVEMRGIDENEPSFRRLNCSLPCVSVLSTCVTIRGGPALPGNKCDFNRTPGRQNRGRGTKETCQELSV